MSTRGVGGPRPVSDEFAGLDAACEAEMDDRGLAPATRDAYGRVARSCLVSLEQGGICCLDDVGGASVLTLLEALLERWAKSSLFRVVSNFRRRSWLPRHRRSAGRPSRWSSWTTTWGVRVLTRPPGPVSRAASPMLGSASEHRMGILAAIRLGLSNARHDALNRASG